MKKLFALFIFLQLNLSSAVYDCFTFFNELEILKIRLEELDPMVDYFVVVEGTKTFSGNDKPLFFQENVHLFDKFKDKIIHIVVNDFPALTGDQYKDYWAREEHSRNCILRGLSGCDDKDTIFISDVDEIPNHKAFYDVREYYKKHPTLKSVKGNENQLICELHMRLFLYHLNCEGLRGWNGAVKAAPYWIVKKRSPWTIKILHMMDGNLPKILHAGAHFHGMGGKKSLAYKVESTDPFSSFKDGSLTDEWIDGIMNSHRNIYNSKTVSIDTSFPKYILENLDYFHSIGWIKN